MLNEISKNKLLTIGSIYTISGIVLIGLSAWIYYQPKKEVNFDIEKNNTIKSCELKINKIFTENQKLIEENGLITQYRYNIKRTKDKIDVKSNNLNAGSNVFKDIDSMLLYCNGMKMTYFCMGDGCKGSKIELTLEYNGIK